KGWIEFGGVANVVKRLLIRLMVQPPGSTLAVSARQITPVRIGRGLGKVDGAGQVRDRPVVLLLLEPGKTPGMVGNGEPGTDCEGRIEPGRSFEFVDRGLV